MLRHFLFCLTFLCSMCASSLLPAAPQLSQSAEIIVMTMDPIQSELYAAFGHSAFRIKDDSLGLDVAYNYGIFDFDQPNFYLNFAKGKLYYKLGAVGYERYQNYLIATNRTVREQTLDLSQSDKQKVYDFLTNNAKPEFANYYYNYCYDNCATRIRDVLETVLADRITYDFAYANDSLTYRDLMDRYLDEQPWGDLAIDLCLSSEIDRLADGYAYMYMPEYVERAFDAAQIVENNQSRPLVRQKERTIQAAPLPVASTLIKPIHVFIVLFLIVGMLTHRGLKYGLNYRPVDATLFGVTGFIGFFLLFLWFGTDHLTKYNYNLIWCMPLNLVAMILLFKKDKPAFLRYYFFIYGLLLLLLIVMQFAIPQKLHLAFVPFVLALVLRAFYLFYVLSKENLEEASLD